MSKALVVGAGIGGLATGIALAQADVEVTIFERAADLSSLEVGAGVTVWNNAVKVLDRLGVGEAIRARSTVFDGFEQRNHRGRLLAAWPMTEIARRLGTPAVGISRPVLHSILAEACPQTVRTSAKAVGFEQDDAGVTVRFEDGSTETGDVLIGADGIDSAIRAQLLGRQPTRYSGLTMWRTIIELDDADKPSVPFVNFNGPGTRFVWFGAGPGLLSVEAILATPAGGTDPHGPKQAVLEHFGDLPDPCRSLIEAADDSEIYRVDVVDRPPVDQWGTGRVTLLGDAAHPMIFAIGQGAAQALEDSLAIAGALGSAPGGDPAAALRAYETRRIQRSAHFQATAWRLGRMIRYRRAPVVAARHLFYQATGRIGAKVNEKDMVFEA